MAPKGELIAADKKLRLIDAATGEVGREISQLDAGNASLRGVSFHPNGEVVALRGVCFHPNGDVSKMSATMFFCFSNFKLEHILF